MIIYLNSTLGGPESNVELFWDMLFESYINYVPDADPGTLNNEKTAVEEELSELLADPWINLEQEVFSSLWPKTRYSVTVQQRLANLPYITAQRLQQFRDMYYIPENTTFIIAGDIPPVTMTKIMTDILTPMKSKIDSTWECRKLVESVPSPICMDMAVDQDILFVPNKKTQSYRLDITFKTCIPSFSKKEHRAEWMKELLTGGMSGLLLHECRTVRGLIYSISSDVFSDNVNPDYSFFSISTTVIEDRLIEVLETIFKVLSDVKNDDNQLIRCSMPRLRNRFISAMLNHVAQQSPASYVAQYSSELPWGGCVKTFREAIIDAEEALTEENIRETVRTVCDYENVLVAYSGPSNLNDKVESTMRNIRTNISEY